MDLFSATEGRRQGVPLASRMRPRTIDEFVGQSHIIGEGKLLRRAIEADQLTPMIYYGPPGTGKTTLARVIAERTSAVFKQLNAVTSGVKDIREVTERAKATLDFEEQRTILFIDEIHRFNKSQQDALLPYVEDGTIILIGATTENPMFEINRALLSRSRLFEFRPLTDEEVAHLLHQALSDEERGFGKQSIKMDELATKHLVDVSNGDARTALNALELAVVTTMPQDDGVIYISLDIAEESIQRRMVHYDKNGDEHYDVISAFIKSIRGSDVDATLYWLAKMIYAGEDPRFIARRLMVHAAEDIGLADPNALLVTTSAAHALEHIGMPEGRIPLAEAAMYLATAPKSNSVISGIDQALRTVEKEKSGAVPIHLRDTHSASAKVLGKGEGYKYPHDYEGGYVPQQYLPDHLVKRTFYKPTERGYEKTIQKRIDYFQERNKRV
ncbi:AAA family ATPase [Bacillaceae bacterium SIJ1]|uniref:AAA family ATPase n=1 Tax=Litoribacterium kuwaitense TaxID=1398745 RepID=UPI0013E9ACB8|nr:AAA family ATPase [Litoribacterium kuwaitense]NGP43449.1 AAA family ATPase [Litoribacterium kuwaitense]